MVGKDNVKYFRNSGDQYTRVRCTICDSKYTQEDSPEGCPNGCVVEEKTEAIHLGDLGKGDK